LPTAFRDAPFNAPFYSGLGFAELPLDAEVPAGIDPRSRVLMIRLARDG